VLAAAIGLLACAPGSDAELRAEGGSATTPAARYAGIHQRSIALGNLDAPLEMFELSDLRCHYCRDFARNTLPVLLERYVRPGRLRLIFHNLPILGEPSQRAARMALALSLQNHMWEFLDAFYASDGAGDVSDDFLRRVAGLVPDVDVDKALRERDDEAVVERLTQAEGVAREFHLRGVPMFILARTGEELHPFPVQTPGDPAAFVAVLEALLAPR
jgi:protein-disulfide isomerase